MNPSDLNADAVRDMAWVDELMSHPAWRRLEKHFMEEVEVMAEVGIAIRSQPNPVQNRILNLCNLEPPKNKEERLEVYENLCAVVSFMRKKMNTLKAIREKYNKEIRLVRQDEYEPVPTLKGS